MNTYKILHDIESEYDDRDPDFIYRKSLSLIKSAEKEFMGDGMNPFGILSVLPRIHALPSSDEHGFSVRQRVLLIERMIKTFPTSDVLIDSCFYTLCQKDEDGNKYRNKLMKIVSKMEAADISFREISSEYNSIQLSMDDPLFALTECADLDEFNKLLAPAMRVTGITSYSSLLEIFTDYGHMYDRSKLFLIQEKYKEIQAEHTDNGWPSTELILDAYHQKNKVAMNYFVENALFHEFSEILLVVKCGILDRIKKESIHSIGINRANVSSALIFLALCGDLSENQLSELYKSRIGMINLDSAMDNFKREVKKEGGIDLKLRDSAVPFFSKLYDDGKIRVQEVSISNKKMFAMSSRYKKEMIQNDFVI